MDLAACFVPQSPPSRTSRPLFARFAAGVQLVQKEEDIGLGMSQEKKEISASAIQDELSALMQPVIGGAPGPIQKVEDAMNCAKIEGSLRARSDLRRDTVSILQLLPHS